jgi:hypothetical protein
MGLFNRKPKIVKEIHDKTWGYLVQQGIDVDTLSRDIRCVEREGKLDSSGESVTYLRVFSLREAEQKGIGITGWETFNEHPELILFEGYTYPYRNEIVINRKRSITS